MGVGFSQRRGDLEQKLNCEGYFRCVGGMNMNEMVFGVKMARNVSETRHFGHFW